MQPYYKGAGYVFENLIEKALSAQIPGIIIKNESEIQKMYGSYKGSHGNVNGVDLLCSDGKNIVVIQAKLVSSQPKTKSIQDFIDTSLMIEEKIKISIHKFFVTTFMPYNPGIELCKKYNVQIIHHQHQNILIDNLISILKFGYPIYSKDIDADGDSLMLSY